ncbi:uncharacterized protein LOC134825656 [Bolinopsis microptera]|uniref:uncharacterized protein LOC134825656 n=1 Tax=Bolinopsis microptera TaxID=2820187 RepID=UPI00307B0D23
MLQEVANCLELPFKGSQLTVKKLEIENTTLKVSYELPSSAEQMVPRHVTKIEINVFTEDNVKQAPFIDLNSSNEALERCGRTAITPKRQRRITEVNQRKAKKKERRRMTDPVNYSVYRDSLSNSVSYQGSDRRPSVTSHDSRKSSISGFVASLNDLRKGALSHVSGQLTKMAKLKCSLTIALIFIAAVVGYSPRFCASVLDLLQIGVPVQLSIASNIAIAFWPISNSLIYCFRNKEIFTVVFGISDGMKPKRTRAHTWPGSERY